MHFLTDHGAGTPRSRCEQVSLRPLSWADGQLSSHALCNPRAWDAGPVHAALCPWCWWFSHTAVRLCSPMDCSPPGSSVHVILWARILEWVAISSSRDLPDPRIKPSTPVSHALAYRFFTTEPAGKLPPPPPERPHLHTQSPWGLGFNI